MNTYEDGSIEKIFDKVAETNESRKYFSGSELAILDLLESNEPAFKKKSIKKLLFYYPLKYPIDQFSGGRFNLDVVVRFANL